MGRIRPQPGPQLDFLKSPADIAIFGGAAGAGKTFGLLLEACRKVADPNWRAVIFRETYPQIKAPGGPWETSFEVYPAIGGIPLDGKCEWKFPSGAKILFRHMQHEKNRKSWDGSQMGLACFDQLEHFTARQFFYLLSRLRSRAEGASYVRATVNPTPPEHWVRGFIDWWIDPNTGLPIKERSGKLRAYVRQGSSFSWGDDPVALQSKHGTRAKPRTVTFIPGLLVDNPAVMAANPDYMANLEAMDPVDMARLLYGKWNEREGAGMYFDRETCPMIDPGELPARRQIVRGWDLASTRVEAGELPPDNVSASASSRIGYADGVYFFEHFTKFYEDAHGVERRIRALCEQEPDVLCSIPQDPGGAGKSYKPHLAEVLDGMNFRFSPEIGSKPDRFSGFSSQARAGNVKFVRGSWNQELFSDLESFPEGGKDAADSASRAYNEHLRMNKKTKGRRVGVPILVPLK